MCIEANENRISKEPRPVQLVRTSSDVVCELSYERREVCNKLDRLYKAIAADPKQVSERHKDLWKMQAKAMQEYVDVLGLRIKDLLDSDA